MKTAAKTCLRDIRPQLKEIISQLTALDEKAAGLSDNAWLREEIGIMRQGGREADRRRDVDKAAAERESGWQEITRDFARLVGKSADEVVVDRARINRVLNWVGNLLREAGDRNV